MALHEMNHRLGEATVRAQGLAVEVEVASRAKSEFLSVMSHELRTPLNGVLGFARLLANTALNDEQKSFAKRISSSGEHLLAVVNDILDFSSIEHGSLAIKVAPLSIGELVESSTITIRQAAAEKGIEFRSELTAGVPEQIAGDERRIRQILINLLGNAVKFTSSGSVILRVVPDAEGRFLDFSVEDTGIGISSEILDHLFQPFVQADSTTSRWFEGSGLGLAITKRLAEVMGGSITVASTPEKGSVFTFRFPLSRSAMSQEWSLEMNTPKYPILDRIEVPQKVIEIWQEAINLLAEIADIPAALIMRVHARDIEVFVASHSADNVYHHGEKTPLDTGLYCETVISTQRELLVPNALRDPVWDHNPDIKLGMVSYLGLPLIWPTGQIFGTICILDKQENAYSQRIRHLMERVRDSIQFSLQVLYDASAERKQAEEELRRAHDELEHRVQERTSELAAANASLLAEITERQRTEELLVKAEQIAEKKSALHKMILESPQGVVVFSLDPGYRYTEFSSAHRETMRRLWGVEIQLGMNMLDAIGSPDDRERAKRHFDCALQGEFLLVEEEYGDQSLSRTFYDNRYSPLRDALGNILGLTVFVTDVSKRKRTEELLRRSEVRFRTFFELPLHGRCITSPEKGWLEINDRLCEILGYARQEILGKTWAEMTHPGDLAADLAQFDRMLSGAIEQYKLEKRFIRKDGTTVWTEISVGCVRKSDGSVDQVICVMEDISKRKEMDAKLLEALHLAETATAAKSEFLAMMSHELRSPLSGMLGFAQLLSVTSLDEKQLSYLRMITESGRHLLAVVNDLLDISSIGSGKMSLEAELLSLADLVEQSATAARLAASDKGIEFRCEMAASVPDQITGDARRIQQILINLLANAVKFTAGGSVVLRVARSGQGAWASRPCEAPVTAAMPDSKRAGRQSSLGKNAAPTVPEESFLEFSVKDTGIGISAGTLARLFEPFTQADATTSRLFGGTGLGLAITKRLAEAMGGSITVTSVLEKGSTFTFRLPLKIPPLEGGSGSLPLCREELGGGTPLPSAAYPGKIRQTDPVPASGSIPL